MKVLSAVIIAKDEEHDLPGALESLKGLASEVIVLVDESSRDATEEIARAGGARVFRRRFEDYAGQKQAALDKATGEWVLSIDADERATPELKAEILGVLSGADGRAGFQVPFEVRFLGRRLRWGGLGSETHLRLFRRGRGRFTGGALHEGVEVSGTVGTLRGRIIHEPYRDLSDYLAKLESYTTLAARKRYAQGRRFRAWHHLLPFWEFFCRAILKLGFLDGREGLLWAGLSAFHAWLRYAKLWEMERWP